MSLQESWIYLFFPQTMGKYNHLKTGLFNLSAAIGL